MLQYIWDEYLFCNNSLLGITERFRLIFFCSAYKNKSVNTTLQMLEHN